ncbi:hypothetical protein GEMRC1_005755 [Eukaryota sp. GEM-RC1]
MINSYADDASLVNKMHTLKPSFARFVDLSGKVGLTINLSKCVVIGRVNDTVLHEGVAIHFINYSSDCIKFLGNFIGKSSQIMSMLEMKIDSLDQKLRNVLDLNVHVGKQVSFATLQVCFAGKVNHFLRGLPAELMVDLSRRFNALRTEFLSELVESKKHSIHRHSFAAVRFGGIGFPKLVICVKVPF